MHILIQRASFDVFLKEKKIVVAFSLTGKFWFI